MKLEIEWSKPIRLRSGRREGLIYTLDLNDVDNYPGIYVFARAWGRSMEALYVGRSTNVRRRIRGHLNNLKLMSHLDGAKNGKRVLIVGYPWTKPGQRMDKVLATLERAYIRH
ncbi:MAG TPA: GIY-YIG nuclease family protein, partial [Spirochaetia bacterium]|nr:GIY-YIG nuclease family protein [Spirochaetia bacterium]